MNESTIYIIEGKEYSGRSTKDSPKFHKIKNLSIDESDILNLSFKSKDYTYKTNTTIHLFETNKKHTYFKAKFVGVLYADNETKVISLPKYVSNLFELNDDLQLEKYWSKLEKLLYKYSDDLIHRDPLFNRCSDYQTCELAFAKQFFELYIRNDLYLQKHKSYSYKKGKTSWGKTVNKITPDYIDGSILYQKTIKENFVSEVVDITDIQISILQYLYVDCGYQNIFKYNLDIPNSKFSSNFLLEDKNKAYLLKILNDEKQICFKDDDIKLINMMISFINEDYRSELSISKAFGIVEFYHLFEVVLGDYFGNQLSLDMKGDKLNVVFKSKFLKKENSKFEKIPDINDAYRKIKGLGWTFENPAYRLSERNRNNKGIEIPDIIIEYSHIDRNTEKEQKYVFIIDAKYDDFYQNNNIIKNYPADYDVIKQVRYIEMLKDIYNDYDKSLTENIIFKNFFILPWKVKYDVTNSGLLAHPADAYFDNKPVLALIINFDKVIEFVLNDKKTKEDVEQEEQRIMFKMINYNELPKPND